MLAELQSHYGLPPAPNLSLDNPPPIITTQIGNLVIRQNVPRAHIEIDRARQQPPAFRAVLGTAPAQSFGQMHSADLPLRRTESSAQAAPSSQAA
jgi:hypothetical protein